MDLIQAKFEAADRAQSEFFKQFEAARLTKLEYSKIIDAQISLSSMEDTESIKAAIAAMNTTIKILQDKISHIINKSDSSKEITHK